MSEENKNIWPKHITVDKRIVRILSQSTYETFPNAIKEIITNSYDADATEVKVNIDQSNETIIVEDNGKGMSESELEFFLRIAGRKREKGTTTASGRNIIGQFGVGFLASFPFFKNYEIETTKQGSTNIVEASIPSHKYFTDEKIVDIGDIKINGHVYSDPNKKKKHYTKIKLNGFTSMTKEFFNPQSKEEASRYSIQSWDGLEKIKWSLTEDLPIQYQDERFNKLTKIYSPNLSFRVFLNGRELLRETHADILLEANGKSLPFDNNSYTKEELVIDENEVLNFGNIKFQYFILTNKESIHPYEARFFKERNLNAGVGKRSAFGLGEEMGGGRSRLHWLTGEVLYLNGLNELINVSRDDFAFSQDYEDLKAFLRRKLRKHSTYLEKEAAFERQLNEKKIKNVSFLKSSDKKEEPDTEGQEKTNNETPTVKKDLPIDEKKTSTSKNGDKNYTQKKEKKIELKDKEYVARSDEWDYKSSFFPACKIKDGVILINKKYPLFKQVKHTDVFIKLHLLILLNYMDGVLDDSGYEKMMDQIIDIYDEYLK